LIFVHGDSDPNEIDSSEKNSGNNRKKDFTPAQNCHRRIEGGPNANDSILCRDDDELDETE
jgi:hypothetical protein